MKDPKYYIIAVGAALLVVWFLSNIKPALNP